LISLSIRVIQAIAAMTAHKSLDINYIKTTLPKQSKFQKSFLFVARNAFPATPARFMGRF
ncbi:TPA: hypothetical protein ACM5N1_003774, partial [Escherichia coli]